MRGALPKAGVMAEAQGSRVSAAIAAETHDPPDPPPYDGQVLCFLEVGRGEVALLQGEFFAEDGPHVRIVEAAPEHGRAMRRFEHERLDDWLGG